MTSDSHVQLLHGHARLQIVKNLIEGYDGRLPFNQYLKKQFLKHRNFGSRDRKLYSEWCFAWFRLGKAVSDEDFFTRLAIANYLVNGNHGFPCEISCEKLYLALKDEDPMPDLASRIKLISTLFHNFNLEDIFHFDMSLSGNINRYDYSLSMLIQPRVWIRLTGTNNEKVIDELNRENYPFEKDIELSNAVSFLSGINLLKLQSYERGYFEIQDRSSQVAGNAVPALPGEHWWDCCCGAGGKSLQLMSRVPSLSITASDKRISILESFISRLAKYPKAAIEFKEMDLEELNNDRLAGKMFDGIIADVPCSGSGTWVRSPEWLSYFDHHNLDKYAERQRKILDNVLPFLKPGGTLVYITCSVLRQENEDIADWLNSKPEFNLINQHFVDGTKIGSDSMFYAIFRRKSSAD